MEQSKGSEIKVRMNCPGGEVYSCYGMIAKFAEHKNGKTVQVDGMAKSGGFFFCCYADNVECLDVSAFMVHRAAFPAWVESDANIFTDDVKKQLSGVNASLRAGLESKVSAEKFKTVTGVSLDDMFSLENRIDVNITAQQAKEMGIVNKIMPLTKEKENDIKSLAATYGIAAFSTETEITIKQNKKMTSAEFKLANPEAAAELIKEGAKAESIRVKTILAWHTVDPITTMKMVKEGTEMTADVAAEFQVKAISARNIEDVNADGSAPITTPAKPKSTPETATEAAALEAFNKQLAINLQHLKK